jgi:hypothetical protein
MAFFFTTKDAPCGAFFIRADSNNFARTIYALYTCGAVLGVSRKKSFAHKMGETAPQVLRNEECACAT